VSAPSSSPQGVTPPVATCGAGRARTRRFLRAGLGTHLLLALFILSGALAVFVVFCVVYVGALLVGHLVRAA
jgi:hypothetical protein